MCFAWLGRGAKPERGAILVPRTPKPNAAAGAARPAGWLPHWRGGGLARANLAGPLSGRPHARRRGFDRLAETGQTSPELRHPPLVDRRPAEAGLEVQRRELGEGRRPLHAGLPHAAGVLSLRLR